jgi:hypothetical protein
MQPNIQKHYSAASRSILIDWLFELQMDFKYDDCSMHLCVEIFDNYASKQVIKREELQLVGITSFILAGKISEIYGCTVSDAVYYCEKQYTTSQVVDMERTILTAVDFDIVNLSDESIQLSRIQDINLKRMVQYLFETSLINSARAKLDIKTAKQILTCGGTKTVIDFKYNSMNTKFKNLQAKLNLYNNGLKVKSTSKLQSSSKWATATKSIYKLKKRIDR